MIVRDAMHESTLTTHPHRSLADAVVTMETLKVKRLPVLLGSQLVGLLTDGDVIRHSRVKRVRPELLTERY